MPDINPLNPKYRYFIAAWKLLPLPLANMRSLGRKHVFVVCDNPDCHRNAELDVSWLPHDVTYGDLQPRMLLHRVRSSRR